MPLAWCRNFGQLRRSKLAGIYRSGCCPNLCLRPVCQGWGVRKITFVDNATVSFSNPVRQPLFDFKDCLHGGAKKAHRASEALSEIYPGVDSGGHVISVPMAGHPITDESKVKADFETLQRLVDEHDAILLLMDTRESRWLPTVMGKAAGKIVMNAALGFDTFLVMRHGVKMANREDELGCYFCNDVVAPADVRELCVATHLQRTNCGVLVCKRSNPRSAVHCDPSGDRGHCFSYSG